MGSQPRKAPKYCKHSSGKGFVWKGRTPIYFSGLHNSPESLEEYASYVRQLRGEVPAPPPPEELTVLKLLDIFTERRFPKLPANEKSNYRTVIKLTANHFADVLAWEFGPARLQKAREIFSEQTVRGGDKPWSRSHVNSQIKRLTRIFKWAVSAELVPAEQWAAMKAVEPLKAGESPARGTEIRGRMGIEASQVSLGHASLNATLVYAERDMELARKVAREMG